MSAAPLRSAVKPDSPVAVFDRTQTNERPSELDHGAFAAALRWGWSEVVLAVCLALLLVGLASQHSLWPDETFSLAMATGHSLEHPASAADPAKGDYQEPPGPVSPAAFRQYAQHDNPPAGVGRVIRAVKLSDTSPPLYYLLLNGWSRVIGTGEIALRLFSVIWALACLPVFRRLTLYFGGSASVLPAMVLFGFAPFSLYYFTEGRMYSLLLFLVLSLVLLTVELIQRGPTPYLLLLWFATSVGGLLSHYFFAPIWALCLAWLVLSRDGYRSIRLWVVALSVGIAIAPWYIQLPGLLRQWRVTGEWLTMIDAPFGRFGALVLLPLRFVLPTGTWYSAPWTVLAAMPLVFLAAGIVVWQLRWGVARLHPFLVLWLCAALLAPLSYDLLNGTTMTAIGRYAITGLPALMLLGGSQIGRLAPRWRGAVLVLIVLAWLPGIAGLAFVARFEAAPFADIAAQVDAETQEGDLIIVHSIPSGVISYARATTRDTPILSWVGQLGQRRVPEDLERLSEGYRRIVVVQAHAVSAPPSEVEWLRENARHAGQVSVGGASVDYFLPATGNQFGDSVVR